MVNEASNASPVAEQPPPTTPRAAKSEYKVLARTGGEEHWIEMGETKATGPDVALEQLVEQNESVKQAVAEERIELVAVNLKFWRYSKPSFSAPSLKL